MGHKEIPVEALINLRHRLDGLPSRCQERRILIEETAALYGVSIDTLYRAWRNSSRPKSINPDEKFRHYGQPSFRISVGTSEKSMLLRVVHNVWVHCYRSDSGTPRKISLSDMERYCEVIAAMKIRTSNKKGRHVSTVRAIELLEEFGMETPDGFVQPPKGALTRSTVNYYLKTWGYDTERMTRQPPAVRFQAEYSNSCWHFDKAVRRTEYSARRHAALAHPISNT